MFKIPSWGNDVPKSSVDFGSIKVSKNKKINENVNDGKPKQAKSKTHKNKSKPQKDKPFVSKKVKNTKKNLVFKPNNNINKIGNSPATGSIDKKKKSRKRKLKEPITDVPVKQKKIKFNTDKNLSITPSSNTKGDNQENNSNPQLIKLDKKKEKLKSMLLSELNRNKVNANSNLRQRMMERLKAAQFRFLNEKLYTTTGAEAQQLFQTDPNAFHTYHEGYQLQLKKWPVKPLDVIVKRISKMPASHVIADMGCGQAELSKRVRQTVRSFDLVGGPGVECCDMARTPLATAAVDVAVYCLALMGTDLTQYLLEANRILKMGGHLLIAEVESRFDKVETFTDSVQRLGFKLNKQDKSHKVFYFFEFTKVREPPAKKSKLPVLTLKPCLYKKR